MQHSGILIAVFLLCLTFFQCKEAEHSCDIDYESRIDCLEKYQDCSEVYEFDSTYKDLVGNLLFAAFRKRLIDDTVFADVFEELYLRRDSLDRSSYVYQLIVSHFFDSRSDLNDITSSNFIEFKEMLSESFSKEPSVLQVNLLEKYAELLRDGIEINQSLATSLTGERYRELLSDREKSYCLEAPYRTYMVTLLRERVDYPIWHFYGRKTLERLPITDAIRRRVKSLMEDDGNPLSAAEYVAAKKKLLQHDQFSPKIDSKIEVDLLAVSNAWVGVDSFPAVLARSPFSCENSQYFNAVYLVDDYMKVGDLSGAEKWLKVLQRCINNRSQYYYLSLSRKQQFYWKKYLLDGKKANLNKAYTTSLELHEAYSVFGEDVISEHYADAIYYANNIMMECIAEAQKQENFFASNNLLVSQLNHIKVLYKSISDGKSSLGNRIVDDKALDKLRVPQYEIAKRELSINGYRDTTYTDLGIFEELYHLYEKVQDIKLKLPIDTNKFFLQQRQLELDQLSDDVQILDWIKTDSSYFLTSITSSGIDLRKLETAKTTASLQYYESVSEQQGANLPKTQTYLEKEVQEVLSQEKSRIMFVPDTDFYTLPFEAFRYQDGDSLKYLIQQKVITYGAKIEDAWNWKPAEIGNDVAVFSYSDEAALRSLEGKTHLELEHGLEEARQVASMYPDCFLVKGKGFDRSAVAQHLQKDIVHICSHSSSNTSNPLGNYIVVRNEQGQGQQLYGYELKRKNLPKNFVILSSCESGVGATKPGTGVFSLSRDLLLAGAQTVIKSLWKVDDQSTQKVMSKFHENFKNGSTAAEALAEAKRYVANETEFGKPFYWAGFVLEGNGGIVQAEK